MEIITKDSKLYLKVYEIKPNTNSDIYWKRVRRFTNWDLAKKFAYELLGYSSKGSLSKGLNGWFGEVDDIEPPELVKKKDLYIEYYIFKPDKKYAREKEISIEIIFIEITQEELNELKGVSL